MTPKKALERDNIADSVANLKKLKENFKTNTDIVKEKLIDSDLLDGEIMRDITNINRTLNLLIGKIAIGFC